MSEASGWVTNAAGREVPTTLNGRAEVPFQGVGGHRPEGRRHGPRLVSAADYPSDGNKLVPDLRAALERAGLTDGMTISTHHHLRDGDLLVNEVFRLAREMGVKDLVWFPSASFPCHAPLIDYLKDGTIQRIEGSMNGPLGLFCSRGGMKGTAVLRSHGGRFQAVQDGEVQIDIAVLAAPEADPFGNANGLGGPSACGALGYALADLWFAEKVIVATDHLVPFPCVPLHLEGNFVDHVVEVERLGIPEKIVSGTTRITRSPDRLRIAELATRFVDAAGLVRDGMSFQSGAGGTSLAIGEFLHRLLKERDIAARFCLAGTTEYTVRMLEDGCLGYILDGQVFDLEAVRSMRENPNHVASSVGWAYNYHAKGNYIGMVDVMILGATEVDVDFNGNVVTHSDGYLLHGIGGWQNCLGARCVILPVPLFRDRIPVIRDRVTTLCGPGELIDVVVTERGIAVNPRREDLLAAVAGKGLPIRTIQDMKDEAESICGRPDVPEPDDRVVAAVKWVDGTVLDVVRQVRE